MCIVTHISTCCFLCIVINITVDDIHLSLKIDRVDFSGGGAVAIVDINVFVVFDIIIVVDVADLVIVADVDVVAAVDSVDGIVVVVFAVVVDVVVVDSVVLDVVVDDVGVDVVVVVVVFVDVVVDDVAVVVGVVVVLSVVDIVVVVVVVVAIIIVVAVTVVVFVVVVVIDSIVIIAIADVAVVVAVVVSHFSVSPRCVFLPAQFIDKLHELLDVFPVLFSFCQVMNVIVITMVTGNNLTTGSGERLLFWVVCFAKSVDKLNQLVDFFAYDIRPWDDTICPWETIKAIIPRN